MSHRKRNYHAEVDKNPTMIRDYVEALSEWVNYPAKIISGEMQVMVRGHWVGMEEFNTHFQKPNPSTFIQTRENIDSTTNWVK